MICFDDDGGEGTNSLIADCHIPADGDYYIHVSPFNTMGGKYKLILTTLGGLPNGTEISQIAQGVDLTNVMAASAPVIITNASGKGLAYDLNSGNGVRIESNGSVTLTNIEAYANGMHGVTITNNYSGASGIVKIASGTFDYNSTGGLFVQSNRSITLTKVNASYNGGVGVYLTNDLGSSGFQPISIINDVKNMKTEGNGFQNNEVTGLIINATGKVTLTNLEAIGNGVNGAQVTNNALEICGR